MTDNVMQVAQELGLSPRLNNFQPQRRKMKAIRIKGWCSLFRCDECGKGMGDEMEPPRKMWLRQDGYTVCDPCWTKQVSAYKRGEALKKARAVKAEQ